jgi:hypothetical protein
MLLNEPVQQRNKRYRLDFKNVGQIYLGEALVFSKAPKDDPLCAGSAAFLGPTLDIVPNQARCL